jgi:hypothetical protein
LTGIYLFIHSFLSEFIKASQAGDKKEELQKLLGTDSLNMETFNNLDNNGSKSIGLNEFEECNIFHFCLFILGFKFGKLRSKDNIYAFRLSLREGECSIVCFGHFVGIRDLYRISKMFLKV